MKTWITLSDYSAKFDVSVSTLRRRIKSEKAEYKFEDGKYMLLDCPLNEHNPNTQLNTQPPTGSAPFAPPQESLGVAVPATVSTPREASTPPKSEASQSNEMPNVDSSHFWVTVNAMMNELKKAYSLILQEKEEQILQLKDEHSDLRTLIRVLEEENSRLKKVVAQPDSLDSWLEKNESL